MEKKKPANIDDYKKWLRDEHHVEISETTKNYYDTVSYSIREVFEKSEIWNQLIKKEIPVFAGEYLLKNGDSLLTPSEWKLHRKSFDSFLLKTFRKNCLDNKEWPNCPIDGWILPDNWFSRINDIVRTSFVVKYLDGVKFIVEKIEGFLKENSLPCTISYEAKEEGYYAAHLYTIYEFEVPKPTWDTMKIRVSVEVQITTTMQEVLKKLLHVYYEGNRLVKKDAEPKWKWDYNCEEFSVNYLGHILHYVEGKIVGIREEQRRK